MPDSSSSYCRDLEAYLCQKNDGHLVRIVGPAFDTVTAWLADGIPFKVACAGIDRYFERYYRRTSRRRPVRIDFCDADVRDVFDEWRRATGVTSAARQGQDADAAAAAIATTDRRGPSLPEHLERALLRLTNARATGLLGEAGDPILDAVAKALDAARAAHGGVRGEARRALLADLAVQDRALGAVAVVSLPAETLAAIRRDADQELSSFRDQLPGARYDEAVAKAVDRLARARLGLPTLSFS